MPLRGGVARWCVASPAETARGCLTHPSRALAWLASHPPHPCYSLLGFRDLPPTPYQGGLRKKAQLTLGYPSGAATSRSPTKRIGDPKEAPRRLPDAFSCVFLGFLEWPRGVAEAPERCFLRFPYVFCCFPRFPCVFLGFLGGLEVASRGARLPDAVSCVFHRFSVVFLGFPMFSNDSCVAASGGR